MCWNYLLSWASWILVLTWRSIFFHHKLKKWKRRVRKNKLQEADREDGHVALLISWSHVQVTWQRIYSQRRNGVTDVWRLFIRHAYCVFGRFSRRKWAWSDPTTWSLEGTGSPSPSRTGRVSPRSGSLRSLASAKVKTCAHSHTGCSFIPASSWCFGSASMDTHLIILRLSTGPVTMIAHRGIFN